MSPRAVGGRKCLSAHYFGWHCNGTALDGLVPRSNRETIERHRSQRSVLLRVLGRMSGHDRMDGRCRTNGAPSRLALRATGSAGWRLDLPRTPAEEGGTGPAHADAAGRADYFPVKTALRRSTNDRTPSAASAPVSSG